ncbi:endonuclease/exonuclease/phosphatase family protein [Streptomyces thermolineatus]|uniref:endonuclease/exonuclease/phosphatase family protein n=1 Tax=Streptomyces thermolineatus TaxID=44033 RepID=UPI00384D8BFC
MCGVDTGRTVDEKPAPKRPRTRPRTRTRTRGKALAVAAVLTALLTAFPGLVPDTAGNPGSLLETFRPWTGPAVPVLLLLALLRRSRLAAAATLLPAAVWLGLFGPALLAGGGAGDGDRNGGEGRGDGRPGALTVVQHNASDENPDPEGAARALAEAGPDVLALQELLPGALPAYRRALAADYPHHAVVGTVGLWSKHPLSGTRPVDIRPEGLGADWNRGMRTVARTPHGPVAVYVAHLPSVRITPADGFASDRRDESAAALGRAVAAEELDRVVLLGDLNGVAGDRALAPLTSRLRPAHEAAGRGFGLTFPAAFPVVRIDQVMVRGLTPVRAWTLPATGSDHLPVAARLAP